MFFTCEGNFKRDSEKKKEMKNLFTDDQKQIIKDAIFMLNNLLKKQNKEIIPLKLYEYYIDEEDAIYDDDA